MTNVSYCSRQFLSWSLRSVKWGSHAGSVEQLCLVSRLKSRDHEKGVWVNQSLELSGCLSKVYNFISLFLSLWHKRCPSKCDNRWRQTPRILYTCCPRFRWHTELTAFKHQHLMTCQCLSVAEPCWECYYLLYVMELTCSHSLNSYRCWKSHWSHDKI